MSEDIYTSIDKVQEDGPSFSYETPPDIKDVLSNLSTTKNRVETDHTNVFEELKLNIGLFSILPEDLELKKGSLSVKKLEGTVQEWHGRQKKPLIQIKRGKMLIQINFNGEIVRHEKKSKPAETEEILSELLSTDSNFWSNKEETSYLETRAISQSFAIRKILGLKNTDQIGPDHIKEYCRKKRINSIAGMTIINPELKQKKNGKWEETGSYVTECIVMGADNCIPSSEENLIVRLPKHEEVSAYFYQEQDETLYKKNIEDPSTIWLAKQIKERGLTQFTYDHLEQMVKEETLDQLQEKLKNTLRNQLGELEIDYVLPPILAAFDRPRVKFSNNQEATLELERNDIKIGIEINEGSLQLSIPNDQESYWDRVHAFEAFVYGDTFSGAKFTYTEVENQKDENSPIFLIDEATLRLPDGVDLESEEDSFLKQHLQDAFKEILTNPDFINQAIHTIPLNPDEREEPKKFRAFLSNEQISKVTPIILKEATKKWLLTTETAKTIGKETFADKKRALSTQLSDSITKLLMTPPIPPNGNYKPRDLTLVRANLLKKSILIEYQNDQNVFEVIIEEKTPKGFTILQRLHDEEASKVEDPVQRALLLQSIVEGKSITREASQLEMYRKILPDLLEKYQADGKSCVVRTRDLIAGMLINSETSDKQTSSTNTEPVNSHQQELYHEDINQSSNLRMFYSGSVGQDIILNFRKDSLGFWYKEIDADQWARVDKNQDFEEIDPQVILDMIAKNPFSIEDDPYLIKLLAESPTSNQETIVKSHFEDNGESQLIDRLKKDLIIRRPSNHLTSDEIGDITSGYTDVADDYETFGNLVEDLIQEEPEKWQQIIDRI